MRITDDSIMQTYVFYANLINNKADKFEFEFCGNLIQIVPEICLDTALKWHIRIKINDKWDLIGACLNLWDAQVILTERYIKDVLRIKNES